MAENKTTPAQQAPAPPLSKLPVREFFEAPAIQAKFAAMLGKKAAGFIASVLQIVNNSKELKVADPLSIFNAAATAAALDLPINNSLGFAWIVPFKGKAQFQIGAKGFVQLGQRSGQYAKMNVVTVHVSQFIRWNEMTEELETDMDKEPAGGVHGYMAYFKLINGFEKTVYWKMAKVLEHAKKFSKSFDHPSSVWKTDFNAMAEKTVIKTAISKWGPMSIEMQNAIITDQAVIKDADTVDVEYVDNADETPEETAEKLKKAAERASGAGAAQ